MKKRCRTLLFLVLIFSLLLFSGCAEEQLEEPQIDTTLAQEEVLEEILEEPVEDKKILIKNNKLKNLI